MFKSSLGTLEMFKQVLLNLPDGCYAQNCNVLFNASIGKHTRHIIELYHCLLQGYENADVSYDRRERSLKMEEDMTYAIQQLNYIQMELERPNKNIKVSYELEGEVTCVESNYFREVMYNLEHTIHHQALIKVAIQHLTQQTLPDSFGVAPSTMQFKSSCAQ